MMTINEVVDLPPEPHECKETFAYFGVAVYYAQCLEKQIGIMLASMFNEQFLETPIEKRDIFYDKELKKTWGKWSTKLIVRKQ